MNSLKNLILITATLFYAGCANTSTSDTPLLTSENGKPAPVFALPSLEGTTVSLSDFAGKYLVLHIATTWCPFCNAEAPYLEKLYQEYKSKNVEVMIIDAMETATLVKTKLRDRFDLTFPILLDGDGEASARFAPKGILPDLARYEVMLASNILIDPSGNIQFMSLLDSQNFDAQLVDLKKRLDELLKNDNGSISSSKILQVKPHLNQAIKAGEQALLSAYIHLEEGYHIQAAEVVDDNLIPMDMTLESIPQLMVGEPVFPTWKEKKFHDSIFRIYEKEIKVGIPVTTAKALRPGAYQLSGKVLYQACTQSTCLTPRTECFHLPVTVI